MSTILSETIRKKDDVISIFKQEPSLFSKSSKLSSSKLAERKKKGSSLHAAAVEWKENSAGYKWVAEQLKIGLGRSIIVSEFNRKKDLGVPGFETRQGSYLSAAILSIWAKEINANKK